MELTREQASRQYAEAQSVLQRKFSDITHKFNRSLSTLQREALDQASLSIKEFQKTIHKQTNSPVELEEPSTNEMFDEMHPKEGLKINNPHFTMIIDAIKDIKPSWLNNFKQETTRADQPANAC